MVIFASVAVGSAGLVVFFLWRYWRHTDVKKSLLHSTGLIHRRLDEEPALEARGFISVRLTNLPAEAVDVCDYLDAKINPACLVCGMAGSGKSSLMTMILKERSEQGEYPCIIFSLKQLAPHQKPEFDLPNFRRIDMSQHTIANISENRYAFLLSFLTALYSDLTMKGIMSHSIRTTLHTLITDRTINTWDDLESKVMKALKENKNANFEQTTLNAILGDIRILKEEVNGTPLNIDFSNLNENLILDFGLIGHGELGVCVTFWGEYYTRMLYKARKFCYVGISEAWRLLNNTETVVRDILKEGRITLSLTLDTQNVSDVAPSNMQMATVFQHKTNNPDDFKRMRQFEVDAITELKGRQFFDAVELSHGQTKIFELDIQGMYEEINEKLTIKEEKQKEIETHVYVPSVSDDIAIQQAVSSSTSVQMVATQKRDKEKLKEQIVELLKSGVFYQNEVCKAVGITDRLDTDRTTVKNILKSLVDSKIAKKEIYINRKGKDVKYYFINEDRAESALHRKGVDDCGAVATSLNLKVLGSYISNQNWDLELSFVFIDFKRLATNFKDDLIKLATSNKPVIFVCMNRVVEAHYRDTLSMAENLDNSKYFVCCLPELAEILRSL